MKQGKFIFSIIVAIYNTEKYLKECIESVVNQDIGFEDNVELILVNDGSNDNSEKICMEYVKKHSNNIKYFYQKNSGVSSARNVGLDNCTGKYVNFLDSDDKFSLNTLSTVKNIFLKHKDIKICSIRPEFFGRINGPTSVDNCYKKDKKVNLLVDSDFTQQAVNNVFIIKTLLDNHKFIQNLSIGEDAMFINSIFIDNPIYYVTNKATYFMHRRNENNSLSESAFKKKTFYIDTVKYYFMDIIKLSKKKYNSVPIFLQNDISTYIAWMLQSNIVEEILTKKEIDTLINNLKTIIDNIDFDIINNNINIEPEYKYMMFVLKNSNVGYKFNPNSIEFINNIKQSNIKYIWVNHSLNKYILKKENQKLIVYCIEMNKFYNKQLKIINDLKNQNNNLNYELDISKNNYNRILSSTSWKITKPLRKIKSYIKKYLKWV